MKCKIGTEYDFLGLIFTIFDVRYWFFSFWRKYDFIDCNDWTGSDLVPPKERMRLVKTCILNIDNKSHSKFKTSKPSKMEDSMDCSRDQKMAEHVTRLIFTKLLAYLIGLEKDVKWRIDKPTGLGCWDKKLWKLLVCYSC